MIALLRECNGEFPNDYLLARLRGRRALRKVRTTAAPPGLDEENIAREHAAEFRWLYRQMNAESRKRLAPLFLLLEWRRIIPWLRQAQAGREDAEASKDYLRESLWHQEIIRQWSRLAAAGDRLALLEKRLVARLPACQGLTRHFAAKDLAAVERQITAAVLVQEASRPPAAPLAEFCRQLIDCYNIIGISKSWLWRLPAPPPPMAAGNLAPAALARIWREGDGRRLGFPAGVRRDNITPGQIAALEEAKKKALWQKVGKRREAEAAIIAYLCYLEAETVQRRALARAAQEGGNGP